MHEATIAQSILDIISTKLEEAPHVRAALKVRVAIGEFRNIDRESLTFAFDSLRTLYKKLSTCELEVDTIKTEALCSNVKHKYNPSIEHGFCCPRCGGGMGKLLCGQELEIVRITMDTVSAKEQNELCMNQ